MSEQDYVEPATVGAAVAALAAARGSTRLLAGGTDVLVQLRSGRVRPDLIVNLKRIPDLSGVRTEAGAFVIGAATPCAVLGEHAALARAWPGVIEAATLIGSKQVQGRASLGGNLCNGSPAADASARSKPSPPDPAARRWPRPRFSWRSVCRRGLRARATPICA